MLGSSRTWLDLHVYMYMYVCFHVRQLVMPCVILSIQGKTVDLVEIVHVVPWGMEKNFFAILTLCFLVHSAGHLDGDSDPFRCQHLSSTCRAAAATSDPGVVYKGHSQ